tara:strand:- start:519 stop:644 length:126 start_codon:yes stop_codon:yes gene_type:complete
VPPTPLLQVEVGRVWKQGSFSDVRREIQRGYSRVLRVKGSI